MQSHKDDTIRSTFGKEECPQGIGRVSYNFVVDGVAELFYLDDVRWCPYLDTRLISLSRLDQKGLPYSAQQGLPYSAQQGGIRVQYGDKTVVTGVKNENNLYSVNLEPLPKLTRR